VDVDEKLVWSTLSAATDDLEALYDAGVVAAAVDGKINVNELANLQKLARCCGVTYDEKSIRAAAAAAA
jgi:DNA-binding transcriptional ArsR family regulator